MVHQLHSYYPCVHILKTLSMRTNTNWLQNLAPIAASLSAFFSLLTTFVILKQYRQHIPSVRPFITVIDTSISEFNDGTNFITAPKLVFQNVGLNPAYDTEIKILYTISTNPSELIEGNTITHPNDLYTDKMINFTWTSFFPETKNVNENGSYDFKYKVNILLMISYKDLYNKSRKMPYSQEYWLFYDPIQTKKSLGNSNKYQKNELKPLIAKFLKTYHPNDKES